MKKEGQRRKKLKKKKRRIRKRSDNRWKINFENALL